MSTEEPSEGVERAARALMGDDRSNEEIEREKRIFAVLDRMTDGAASRRRGGLGFGTGPLGGIGGGPPVPNFDPPVKHNSFAEWEQDYERAKEAHQSTTAALQQLRTASQAQRDGMQRVADFLAKREGVGISIIKCISADNTHHAVVSVLDMVNFWAHVEVTALENQGETYWTRLKEGKKRTGRKQHAKKYWIASELARFYVATLNEKPTFAMTDYGEPSGRYTTALRDIFEIYGLEGRDLRGPAVKAIANAPALMRAGTGVNALGGLLTYWPD